MDSKMEKLIKLMKNAQGEFSKDNLVVGIPSFISKKFIAYCAMKGDLELILEYINELRVNGSKLLQSSLAYSLIALYGKCFTDASRNSYPKLEPNHLFAEGQEVKGTHEYLMELRHQFIAHRGDTDSEVGVAFMLIPKEVNDNDMNDRTELRFSQLKMKGFSEERLTQIEALAHFLIAIVEDKIQNSGQKAHDGMFNLFSPEQLKQVLLNNIK